jgi:opacity protein-like surface antigen
MKKIVLLAAMMAAFSAQAFEVGVTAGRDFAGKDSNIVGAYVGQEVGKFDVTAGFDRFGSKTDKADIYSLNAGYTVLTVGTAKVVANVGAGDISPTVGKNGAALIVGAGLEVPFTKNLALTTDYRFIDTRDADVKSFRGGDVVVGLKASF